MTAPAIRPVDRQPWQPGQALIGLEDADGCPASPTHGFVAVVSADAALVRMLSGVMPESAGVNTRIVSFTLTEAYRCRARSAVIVVDGLVHPIQPYFYGLAEVRAVRAARRAGQ